MKKTFTTIAAVGALAQLLSAAFAQLDGHNPVLNFDQSVGGLASRATYGLVAS